MFNTRPSTAPNSMDKSKRKEGGSEESDSQDGAIKKVRFIMINLFMITHRFVFKPA